MGGEGGKMKGVRKGNSSLDPWRRLSPSYMVFISWEGIFSFLSSFLLFLEPNFSSYFYFPQTNSNVDVIWISHGQTRIYYSNLLHDKISTVKCQEAVSLFLWFYPSLVDFDFLYLSPSHCVLCQLALLLALISGESSVRICYGPWSYIVIFKANVRIFPLKCLKLKKEKADDVETRASRLSRITVVLISVWEHHSAGIVSVSQRYGLYCADRPCRSFICLFCFQKIIEMIKE